MKLINGDNDNTMNLKLIVCILIIIMIPTAMATEYIGKLSSDPDFYNKDSTPEATPLASGSSGGGGGGGGGSTCTESWTCDEWSGCGFLGKQTRSCSDENSCGTASSKPETSKACVYISKFLKSEEEKTEEQPKEEQKLEESQKDETLFTEQKEEPKKTIGNLITGAVIGVFDVKENPMTAFSLIFLLLILSIFIYELVHLGYIKKEEEFIKKILNKKYVRYLGVAFVILLVVFIISLFLYFKIT